MCVFRLRRLHTCTADDTVGEVIQRMVRRIVWKVGDIFHAAPADVACHRVVRSLVRCLDPSREQEEDRDSNHRFALFRASIHWPCSRCCVVCLVGCGNGAQIDHRGRRHALRGFSFSQRHLSVLSGLASEGSIATHGTAQREIQAQPRRMLYDDRARARVCVCCLLYTSDAADE